MVILAGTFISSTFKWDPSLGVQEGATCEYLNAQIQGP